MNFAERVNKTKKTKQGKIITHSSDRATEFQIIEIKKYE